MSLSNTTSNAPSNLYHVPKLASDGSNWITYKERLLTVLGARGLKRHLLGQARRPPTPLPWPRPTPSSITPPNPSLSDEEYLEKVESMEAKVDDYEQKEASTRQQIYGTICDALLLKVKSLETAAAVWEAVSKEHEGKSEMYANSVRTRLLNTRCTEGSNVREHLNTLLLLREELAAMGTPYPDTEFSAAIFQSLPESYGTLLTALATAARLARNPLTPADIIFAVSEEYDRRQISQPSSGDSALATNSGQQLECFNCKRKGHVKADCWRKGGGKEGQ
ncbi:hypothetical protein C8Q70DRAFT_919225, partial [Cubamyces menziesii]